MINFVLTQLQQPNTDAAFRAYSRCRTDIAKTSVTYSAKTSDVFCIHAVPSTYKLDVASKLDSKGYLTDTRHANNPSS